MFPRKAVVWPVIVLLLALALQPSAAARAGELQAPYINRLAQARYAAAPHAQSGSVSAYDLILAMNTMRVSYGLPALIEDPIVNAVAQATADTMAAYLMSWHIGDVKGRIAAAGYGNGATVWATENFAVGTSMSIDEIMLVWADPDHMRPATVPAYCHVGAGVAQASNGSIYYVLQAAYTSTNSCGPYTYPGGGTTGGGAPPVSQIIIPVKIATPDPDGKIFHIVQSGQSFWSIAIAYTVTIADLEFWNNLSSSQALLVGQTLFIPSSSTAGFATPTPVGMVVPSPSDPDGRIAHTVQAYQTLTTIAGAYKIEIDAILRLNGLLIDWPLQIGQVLVISAGNVTLTPTPRPLTPIEMLTPAADGRYYHTVLSGETLLYIANLYRIALADLLSWNGLTTDSIILPEQELLLLVTPPPTETAVPEPATVTPSATPTSTPTPVPPTPAVSAASPTVTAPPSPGAGDSSQGWVIGAVLAVTGLGLLVAAFVRRKGVEE